MNDAYKILTTAPWSGQKVGVIAKFLASVFVLCSFVALSAIVYYSFIEGVQKEHFLFVVGMSLGILYITILFGHVAIKGKAPKGWIPWR